MRGGPVDTIGNTWLRACAKVYELSGPVGFDGMEVWMAAPPIVSRAARLGLRVCGALSFLAPLLTRIAEGHAFFLTGRGKLEHFDTFVSFMTELGIPFPEINAHVIARLEYYGGILLILGLFTRLAAAGLLSTMAVALLS